MPLSRSSRPDFGRADLGWLTATPYAHRGLHAGKDGHDGERAHGLLENSLPAFAAALRAGHGIECDVQPAADGTAMVFHDRMLDRLTTATGPLAARTPDDLAAIALHGAAGTIPRLTDLLALVAGRRPLLIEIKADSGRLAALCASVCDALRVYRGPVAVMSFAPAACAWFAHHAPDVVRGLVISEDGQRGWRGKVIRALALCTARPDFLACDVRDLPSAFTTRQRAQGLPLLCWTVRSPAMQAVAARYADQIIYEPPVAP